MTAKQIESELNALDTRLLNKTMEELCRESTAESPWLKCIQIGYRMSPEPKNITQFLFFSSYFKDSYRFEDNVAPNDA